MGRRLRHLHTARVPIWRNRTLRYAVYQLAFLGAVVWGIFSMFANAQENLRSRGIQSGFGFLYNTDSLFAISETMPVPVPEGGGLFFLVVLSGGVAGTWLLSRWAKARNIHMGDDNRLVTIAVCLLVILPGLVLYSIGHTIRTVEYIVPSTYGMGLLTGLMNTLKLGFFSLIFGTIVGLVVGIARLSSNWLVSLLSGAFIEVTRNIPLLLQIFFWYFAVLRTLPPVRQSLKLDTYLILNNRGLTLPQAVGTESFAPFMATAVLALVLIFYWARYVRRRQNRTGEQLPVFWPSMAMLFGLPIVVWLLLGSPFTLVYPELRGFNYSGGLTLSPEFSAMLVSLVFYSGGFIAEIVRSGIQAIPFGQIEAAKGIGLSWGKVLRLVILPQARRLIIPPLTANWLGTIKDTSLGVAVGYPELVAVGGTILDVSGHSLEVIGLTMLFYMLTSLLVSLFMNWYNATVQLKSR